MTWRAFSEGPRLASSGSWKTIARDWGRPTAETAGRDWSQPATLSALPPGKSGVRARPAKVAKYLAVPLDCRLEVEPVRRHRPGSEGCGAPRLPGSSGQVAHR